MSGHDYLSDMAGEAVQMVKGKSILDVGTGFGVVVSHVISKTECNLVSIDPEAWTFDELERKYRSEIEAGRLKLLTKAIENPNFDENAFETSISISSLHHLDSPVKGIKNMEMATSKRVIIADWNGKSAGVENPHSREEMEKSERAVKEYLIRNSYNLKENEYWYLAWKDL